MKKKLFCASALFLFLFGITGIAQAFVWGVNPNAANQIINIDPFTGTIISSFADPTGTIGSTDTEIGLAGWSNNTLFMTNENGENGVVFNLDTQTGTELSSYSVSGGWGMDGLGYYSDSTGSWIYTSGCSVEDMHRYDAVDGAAPQFYWSDIYDPRAVAGDNGGKIFSYGSVGGQYGIYAIDPLVDTNATFFASSPSDSIVGMAYDGKYLYLSDLDNNLYTMDNSGALINTLKLDYTVYALGSTEGVNNTVPEPATMALFGAGLLGLLGFSRKIKKS